MNRDHLNINLVSSSEYQRYSRRFSACFILTHERQFLLQKRPEHWQPFGGYLTTFGGRLKKTETPIQAIQRELLEELGANVPADQLIELGAVTEACTGHSELIHEYFWHDVEGLIHSCHEGIPTYFKKTKDIQSILKRMDDVDWVIHQCLQKNLIQSEYG